MLSIAHNLNHLGSDFLRASSDHYQSSSSAQRQIRRSLKYCVFFLYSVVLFYVLSFNNSLILLGVSAIKRWSAEAGHLKPDDVIISADVDEVLIS